MKERKLYSVSIKCYILNIQDKIMKEFDNYFNKISKHVPTLQVYFESQRKNITYSYSSLADNQRFHSASVGKVFCATLIMMAIDAQKLTLDQPIYQLIEAPLLAHLFVYKGTDYKETVTIKHLMNHTSGVNDYYEGKTLNHPKFETLIMGQKNHIFTPFELLDFTRNYQKAVGKPGAKFLYSDTGYILLGLILEKLYNQPYHKILREQIYEPLELRDTALCFYDEAFDAKTLAPIIYRKVDMHLENSLSCDYSGGGLQTTTKDLALFLKALFNKKLISKDALRQMMDAKHSFHGIMRYGLGLIELKISSLVPWLRKYPTLYGGLGSLSVHAFYDPKNDDVYIINLGSPSKMRKSFMILVKMVVWLNKI